MAVTERSMGEQVMLRQRPQGRGKDRLSDVVVPHMIQHSCQPALLLTSMSLAARENLGGVCHMNKGIWSETEGALTCDVHFPPASLDTDSGDALVSCPSPHIVFGALGLLF